MIEQLVTIRNALGLHARPPAYCLKRRTNFLPTSTSKKG